MNIIVGHRYRLAHAPERAGIVTEVHGLVAMWAEFVDGKRLPAAPVSQLCERLEPVPIGETIEPGREAA